MFRILLYKYSTTESEKYHSIFSSIDEGFVIGELLYDDSGKAYDLRVQEANRRFHEMLGISDSVGNVQRRSFPMWTIRGLLCTNR